MPSGEGSLLDCVLFCPNVHAGQESPLPPVMQFVSRQDYSKFVILVALSTSGSDNRRRLLKEMKRKSCRRYKSAWRARFGFVILTSHEAGSEVP